MNLVVESLLKKHEIEYALSGKQSDNFEHFINYIVLKNFTSKAFNPEIIGTVKGEVGIDGIAVIVDDNIVTSVDQLDGILKSKKCDINVDLFFIQSKTSENFDASEISLFFTAIKNFFNDKITINETDQLVEVKDIIRKIFENSDKLDSNPNCFIYFATTGSWHEDPILCNIIAELISGLTDLKIFSNVKFTPYDRERITLAYRQIKNNIRKKLRIDQVAIIPAIDFVEEAYIGSVKCNDYIDLITDEDGNLMVNLFEDNVRYFQGMNSVNMDIADTLSDPTRQNRFAFLNNGVTIVAKDISRTGIFFNLKDFQIVNGCQTSFMLFQQRDHIADNTNIIVKLVETKDTDLTDEIVKATNRQTPVVNEAFEILRSFHKNLELAYEGYDSDFRLHYERRSKQYDSMDIDRNKIITLPSQISAYLAMFLGEPQSTHRYYGELLEVNKKRIFREGDILQQYCIASIFLYYVERWLRKNHKEKYKRFKYHIILMLRCLIDSSPLPASNSKSMLRLCEKLYNEVRQKNTIEDYLQIAIQTLEKTIVVMADVTDSYNNLSRSKEFTSAMLSAISVAKDNAMQTEIIPEISYDGIVECKVIAINRCYAKVDIPAYREKGQIHVSELKKTFTCLVSDVLNVGDIVKAKVLKKEKHPDFGYYLSIKAIVD